MKRQLVRFWKFLQEDSWQSWIVSLIIAFVVIKFIFFPLLSFSLGTSLPLVVVESCSMYHQTSNFDGWWNQQGAWYDEQGIPKEVFKEFPFKGGLNKGDIIIVSGRGDIELGDVIIFQSDFKYPLIHRLVSFDPLETKGDNNPGQLAAEKSIGADQVIGKSVLKIPALGWIKLIFFEGFRTPDQRGFCK